MCCIVLQAVLNLGEKHDPRFGCSVRSEHSHIVNTCTVLSAKSDSNVMFCLQSHQGLIIDRSLVY